MQSPSSIIPKSKPSPKGKQKFAKKHLVGLIAVAVLIVGIVGFGAYTFSSNQSSSAVCSDQLIQKATPLLAPEKLTELQPVAEEILAKPDYATDVNCVYIVTNYNINLSDAAGVQKHYDQLVKVYNSEVGYSSEFGENTITPENVKQILGFLETLNDQLPENPIQGPKV